MQVPHGKERAGEPVSLLRLKEVARSILPIASATRRLILAEKDVLPASETLAKFEVFNRLLVSELGTDPGRRITTPPSGRCDVLPALLHHWPYLSLKDGTTCAASHPLESRE